ncbi:zinc finger protein [Amycolatopsis orientalis]|uniref:zinc finger protein n=1 Tax=Amycolatopsis orientalis TaxID=31958 RepID=UPI0003A841D0|nr:zinc finger protein [Amycolatopsis orientalis]
MQALIFIDLDHVHPVIEGVWHRSALDSVPDPGDDVTMLCGLTAPAGFRPRDTRAPNGALLTCVYCDYQYRRARGIPIRPDHPGLPRSRPK